MDRLLLPSLLTLVHICVSIHLKLEFYCKTLSLNLVILKSHLGNEVSQTIVLISPEVKDEFLMGIDFLETCELTKPHIIGLRKAKEDASYQLYKELDRSKKSKRY